MLCCFRQLKLPFNQSYLPLKCMLLRTQSHTKIPHTFNEQVLPVQCERLQSLALEHDGHVVKRELLPYNVISRVELIDILECFIQEHTSTCHSPTSVKNNADVSTLRLLSFLDELPERLRDDRHSRHDLSFNAIRHNVFVLPDFVDSSQNLVVCHDSSNHVQRLIVDRTAESIVSCNGVHYSTDKPVRNDNNNNSGRPSEEQLVRVQEGLVTCISRFFVGLHNYSLYHKNVIFHNNISRVTTRGVRAYLRHLIMIQFLAHVKYMNVQMHILKATHHPEDGTVRMRWRISGVTIIKSILAFGRLRANKQPEWIDGFSIFHVGPDGLIHKHICDKIMPDHEEKVPSRHLGVKFAPV